MGNRLSNNLKLNHLSAGTKGPVLVLLHGLNESVEGYRPAIEHLQVHLRVIALDFRGHGLSPWLEPYCIRDYAADLVDFIQTMIRQPVFLAGHSLGGLVAAYLASRHPDLVEGLLLEDPPFFTAQMPTLKETHFYAMFGHVRNLLQSHQESNETAQQMAARVGAWRVSGEDSPNLAEVFGEDYVSRLALELHRSDPRVLDPVLEGTLFQGFDPEQDLPKILCPTHLIAGNFEFGGTMRTQDIKSAMALIPAATHVVWSDAGHDIHTTRPVAYSKALLSFIRSLTKV